jgi:hypothetical protein
MKVQMIHVKKKIFPELNVCLVNEDCIDKNFPLSELPLVFVLVLILP